MGGWVDVWVGLANGDLDQVEGCECLSLDAHQRLYCRHEVEEEEVHPQHSKTTCARL